MRGKFDLDVLLRDNPEAEKQAATIKEALEILRKLRASGIHGDGYTLVEPYGPRSLDNVPKARNFREIKVKHR